MVSKKSNNSYYIDRTFHFMYINCNLLSNPILLDPDHQNSINPKIGINSSPKSVFLQWAIRSPFRVTWVTKWKFMWKNVLVATNIVISPYAREVRIWKFTLNHWLATTKYSEKSVIRNKQWRHSKKQPPKLIVVIKMGIVYIVIYHRRILYAYFRRFLKHVMILFETSSLQQSHVNSSESWEFTNFENKRLDKNYVNFLFYCCSHNKWGNINEPSNIFAVSKHVLISFNWMLTCYCSRLLFYNYSWTKWYKRCSRFTGRHKLELFW